VHERLSGGVGEVGGVGRVVTIFFKRHLLKNLLMMKLKLPILVITLLSIMIGFQSCKKTGGTINSQYGERKSHNNGRACLKCHITGGDNNYWNLFTTESINFADSLYVGIQSASGTVLYMPSALKDGNCNNCHDGITNPRIWVN
jgi:hypothetical protein